MLIMQFHQYKKMIKLYNKTIKQYNLDQQEETNNQSTNQINKMRDLQHIREEPKQGELIKISNLLENQNHLTSTLSIEI